MQHRLLTTVWAMLFLSLSLPSLLAQETTVAVFGPYKWFTEKDPPIGSYVAKNGQHITEAIAWPSLHRMSVTIQGLKSGWIDRVGLNRVRITLATRDETKALRPGVWRPTEAGSEVIDEGSVLGSGVNKISRVVLEELEVGTEEVDTTRHVRPITRLNAAIEFVKGWVVIIQINPTRPLSVQHPPRVEPIVSPPPDPNEVTWYTKPVEVRFSAGVIAWPLVVPTVYYRINQGRSTKYAKPLVFTKSGLYNITYWAETPYGVKSEETTYVIHYDDKPPRVDFQLKVVRNTEKETILRVFGKVNANLSGMRYRSVNTIIEGPGIFIPNYVIAVKGDDKFSSDFGLGVSKGAERQVFRFKVSLRYQNKALVYCDATREIVMNWKGK